MEKLVEVFILYMDMVASFGLVTKLIWPNKTFYPNMTLFQTRTRYYDD